MYSNPESKRSRGGSTYPLFIPLGFPGFKRGSIYIYIYLGGEGYEHQASQGFVCRVCKRGMYLGSPGNEDTCFGDPAHCWVASVEPHLPFGALVK